MKIIVVKVSTVATVPSIYGREALPNRLSNYLIGFNTVVIPKRLMRIRRTLTTMLTNRWINVQVYMHDDVIKLKHFPPYWPFVRVIHRSPVNSPHKGHWRGVFGVFYDLCLNKRLSKQMLRWWFETPSRSLCRYCNGFINWHRHISSYNTGAERPCVFQVQWLISNDLAREQIILTV